MATGRDELAVSLHTIGAETASITGATVDLGSDAVLSRTAMRLDLDVTAAAGTTPTLDVSFDTSKDGAVWVPLITGFATAIAAGTQSLTFGGCRRYVRARWAIGGTGSPSFTFAITGTAAIVYATPADIGDLALAAGSLVDFTDNQKARALWAASDELDLYLDVGLTFPLLSWPDDQRRHCAAIAAQLLKGVEGYSQEVGTRDVFKDMYDRAIAWAKSAGLTAHPGIVDSTPTVEDAGAYVVTDPDRGWGK